MVEAICAKYKIDNISEIRGLNEDFELLKREKYLLDNWNPLQLAIRFNDVDSLRYFSTKLEAHVKMALRSPPIQGFSKVEESSPIQNECFSILLAIHNRSL